MKELNEYRKACSFPVFDPAACYAVAGYYDTVIYGASGVAGVGSTVESDMVILPSVVHCEMPSAPPYL